MMGVKSSAPIAEYRHRFGGGSDGEPGVGRRRFTLRRRAGLRGRAGLWSIGRPCLLMIQHFGRQIILASCGTCCIGETVRGLSRRGLAVRGICTAGDENRVCAVGFLSELPDVSVGRKDL